jgi:ATP-dependent Clp protease, protease subunit
MKTLINLLARNRATATAVQVPSIQMSADEATVYLYGPIVSSALEAEYWGGVASESLVPELAKIDASVIHLRIDSPGGDEIVMSAGGMYMVHRAWTFAFGNKNDLLDTAALLEKVDGTLAAQYSAKTGESVESMLEVMDAETWMTADEAVASKFVDRIAESKKANAKWDLSAYAKAPKLAVDDSESYASATERTKHAQQLRMLRV